MKNTYKLVALILTFLMLTGSTVAYAGTYVSDPVSPNISKPAAEEQQPEAEATPAPETSVEPTVAPEASVEPTVVPEASVEPTVAPEASVEPTPVPEEIEAVVTTEEESGSVNIRAAASMDAEILGTLTSGMSVTVLGVEGDWTQIRTGDIVGYVYSRFLTIVEPEPVAEPEATPAVEPAIIVTANRDVNDLHPGDNLVFSAQLIGLEGVDYSLNWQVKREGSSWEDIPGATGTELAIDITEEYDGCSWRLQARINE